MELIILAQPQTEDAAAALADELDGIWLQLESEDAASAVQQADAVLFCTMGYDTPACWRLKKWISQSSGMLQDRLCSCCVVCGAGCGSGEQALRSVTAQLLSAGCLLYGGGVLCADGGLYTACPNAQPQAAHCAPEAYAQRFLRQAQRIAAAVPVGVGG